MKKPIIKDSLITKPIVIESVDRTQEDSKLPTPILGSYYIKGMTVEEALNQNGRKYPKETWQQPKSFMPGGRYVDESGNLKPVTLFGGLDHVLQDDEGFRLENAAICWFSVKRNEDGTWDGGYDVLDTPQGKIVHTISEYALLKKSSGLVGVSSRAFGDSSIEETTEGTVEVIVPDGFELISWDFVYDPSFTTAKVHVESTERNSLTESIRNLAEADPAHGEYYESVAKSMEGEKPMKIRKLLSENFTITQEEIEQLTSKEELTELNAKVSEAKVELESLELVEDEKVEVNLEEELKRVTELEALINSKLSVLSEENAGDDNNEDDNSDDDNSDDDNPDDDEGDSDDNEEDNPDDGEDSEPEEVTLESLAQEIAELKDSIAELLAYLQPVEDFTHTDDEGNPDEDDEGDSDDDEDDGSSDDNEDVLGGISEEDLEYLNDEELEALLALEDK